MFIDIIQVIPLLLLFILGGASSIQLALLATWGQPVILLIGATQTSASFGHTRCLRSSDSAASLA